MSRTKLYMCLVGILIIFMVAVQLLPSFIGVKSSMAAQFNLPEPTSILKASKHGDDFVLKGIEFDADRPLAFKFILDNSTGKEMEAGTKKMLISCFLSGLTVAPHDLWVNLSPYESDRIMSDDLSRTELGKLMLEQDYLLKLFAASVSKLSEDEFLERTAKVWIKADKAKINEYKTRALITDSSLKVMTENQYLNQEQVESDKLDLFLSRINSEVNNGRRFLDLRNAYHAILLGNWFRAKAKGSAFENYFAKSKIKGINNVEELVKDSVYYLYRQSFNKGVYNFSKNGKKYFSGGLLLYTQPDVEQSSSLSNFNDLQSSSINNPDEMSFVLLANTSSPLTHDDRAKVLEYSNLLKISEGKLHDHNGNDIADLVETDRFEITEEMIDDLTSHFYSISQLEGDTFKALLARITYLVSESFESTIFYRNSKQLNLGSVVQNRASNDRMYDLALPDYLIDSEHQEIATFVNVVAHLFRTEQILLKVKVKKGEYIVQIGENTNNKIIHGMDFNVDQFEIDRFELRKNKPMTWSQKTDLFFTLLYEKQYNAYINLVDQNSKVFVKTESYFNFLKKQEEEKQKLEMEEYEKNRASEKDKKKKKKVQKQQQSKEEKEQIAKNILEQKKQERAQTEVAVPESKVKSKREKTSQEYRNLIDVTLADIDSLFTPIRSQKNDTKKMMARASKVMANLEKKIYNLGESLGLVDELTEVESQLGLLARKLNKLQDALNEVQTYLDGRSKNKRKNKEKLKKTDEADLEYLLNSLNRERVRSTRAVVGYDKNIKDTHDGLSDLLRSLFALDADCDNIKEDHLQEKARLKSLEKAKQLREQKIKEEWLSAKTEAIASLKRKISKSAKFTALKEQDDFLFNQKAYALYADYIISQLFGEFNGQAAPSLDLNSIIKKLYVVLLTYEGYDELEPEELAPLLAVGIEYEKFADFMAKYYNYTIVETAELAKILAESDMPDSDVELLIINRTQPGTLPVENIRNFSYQTAKYRSKEELLNFVETHLSVVDKTKLEMTEQQVFDINKIFNGLRARLNNPEVDQSAFYDLILRILGVDPSLLQKKNGMLNSQSLDALLADVDVKKAVRKFIKHQNKLGFSADEAHKAAIVKSMDHAEGNDILLIHGPAGTGKTSVIAHTVRSFVDQGKRVLILGHTNRSIDSVLQSIDGLDKSIPVLRLAKNSQSLSDFEKDKFWSGNPGAVRKFSANISKRSHVKESAGYVLTGTGTGYFNDDFYDGEIFKENSQQISNEKNILNSIKENQYDVIIVDEASQMSIPELYRALSKVNDINSLEKLVLVGDHNQLPISDVPLQDAQVTQEEKDVFMTSAFEYMADRGLYDQLMLSTCYRMNKKIAAFIADAFYTNILIPGGQDKFDENTFTITDVSGGNVVDSTVTVYDAKLAASKDSKSNEHTADLVLERVKETLQKYDKYEEEDILIVTPYKGQVFLLKDLLAKAGLDNVEVTTIDSIQGGENKVVICDFVVAGSRAASFMTKNRMLVALSRAQEQLHVIADFDAWSRFRDKEVSNVFKLMEHYYEKTILPALEEKASSGLGGIDLETDNLEVELVDLSEFELPIDFEGFSYLVLE